MTFRKCIKTFWDFNILAHSGLFSKNIKKKNGEAFASLVGILPSRRNFLEFQMVVGFWCGEWSAQRTTSAVIQTVRRKTSHNIE